MTKDLRKTVGQNRANCDTRPTSLARPRRFNFRDVEVDAASHSFRRAGVDVHLRPKSFLVLLYLLDHRDRLVTKEELLDAVWHDSAVTEDTLVHSIVELRKALGDDAHHPDVILTVAKSGYRLSAEVDERSSAVIVAPAGLARQVEETTSIEFEFEGDRAEAQARMRGLGALLAGRPERKVLSWRTVALAGAVLSVAAALVAVGAWWASREPVTARILDHRDGSLTLAVMHFDNLSGRRDLDWLHEALTDAFVTELSRAPGLQVLTRQQLLLIWERGGYPASGGVRLDQALDTGRRAGADAVLLGSFAAAEPQLRVNLRLHDTATGRLLLADGLVVARPEDVLSSLASACQNVVRVMDVERQSRPRAR